MTRFEIRSYWFRIDGLYTNAKRARALLGDVRAGVGPAEAELLMRMIEVELHALQMETQRIKRDLTLSEISQDQA